MLRKMVLAVLTLICLTAHPQNKVKIIQMPIKFDAKRIELTKEYMREHYGINKDTIHIQPQMIVLHWTEGPTWESAYKTFYHSAYNLKHNDSEYLGEFGKLNTSVQYLIERNGSIYQFMPDNYMARHIIGLNYLAIGIENVGGMCNKLTSAQLKANVELIRYLKKKYPSIKYLIGHYEYGYFRNTVLWKEHNKTYFTDKTDPSPSFMRAVRKQVKDLNLLPQRTYPYPKPTKAPDCNNKTSPALNRSDEKVKPTQ